MNVSLLNTEKKILAIHRLTALWAFAESGLGGVLHAAKIPFTGLVVGGFAIILICFIAHISNKHYKKILQSLVVVLMVKAAVSPHTPFPAYIAVSFQAILAYGLFSLFKVNLFSILLLAIIAMLESAFQKLFILTLIFGKPLWKATDEVVAYIASLFSLSATNGSNWIIAIYLSIYLIGGILIGLLSYQLIARLSSAKFQSDYPPTLIKISSASTAGKKNQNRKILLIIFFSLCISAILFFTSNELFAVIKTLIWTFTAIIIWYLIIGPVFLRFIRRILQPYQTVYTDQLAQTLSFLPVASQLATSAWNESASQKKRYRIPTFIFTLISWSLVYQDKNDNNIK